MYCKNLLIRHKQTRIVSYCKKHKRHINIRLECKNCSDFNLKRNSTIKKVSNKQKQLERKRDKNMNKKGNCEYCKKYCENLDAHEVYGGSNRKRSIENGFVVLLCRECHSNENIIAELRRQYQRRYEYKHSREEFIKLIGKSYL